MITEVKEIINLNESSFIMVDGKLCKCEIKILEDKHPGNITYENGDKFTGIIKDNKKEGYGTYYFKNGSKYVGDFENDVKNGEGFYVKNKENEENITVIKNISSITSLKNKPMYTTKIEFVDNQNIIHVGEVDILELIDPKSEEKTKTYENGDKYVGNLINDKKDGKGIYYFKNGDRFEGLYVNDLKEGFGTYYYANGGEFSSEYKNDKISGNSKFINKERKEFRINN